MSIENIKSKIIEQIGFLPKTVVIQNEVFNLKENLYIAEGEGYEYFFTIETLLRKIRKCRWVLIGDDKIRIDEELRITDLYELWWIATQRKKLLFRRENTIVKIWICSDPEYPGDFYICKETWIDGRLKAVSQFVYFDQDEKFFVKILESHVKEGFLYVGTEKHGGICDYMVWAMDKELAEKFLEKLFGKKLKVFDIIKHSDREVTIAVSEDVPAYQNSCLRKIIIVSY